MNEPEIQKLKWYTFDQNNSGGKFVVDENVCEVVCIQAINAEEAIKKAETFCDNSDSCPCCGNRWYFGVNDEDGTDQPTHYCKVIATTPPSVFYKNAKLHYFDGNIKTVKFGSDLRGEQDE